MGHTQLQMLGIALSPTYCLPHAMVDGWPTAGDAPDTIVPKLQLKPPGPEAQDNPGAI